MDYETTNISERFDFLREDERFDADNGLVGKLKASDFLRDCVDAELRKQCDYLAEIKMTKYR